MGSGQRRKDSSCVSGPRSCSNPPTPTPTPTPSPSDGCCDNVLVSSTNTEILDYQWTRLGHFTRNGQTGGRPSYRQIDRGLKNYLYYQSGVEVWYVGDILGANQGGLINFGDAKWVEDKGLKVTCEGPGPHPTTQRPDPRPEACTFGESCRGCGVTVMVNGVTYYCASDCDHGEVNVWEENGRVECKCFH